MRLKQSCSAGSSCKKASAVHSSLSASLYTPPSPTPLCSPAHITPHCSLLSSSSSFPLPHSKASGSSKRHKHTSCKWVCSFLQLRKLSMEAEEGFLLQQQALEGLPDDSKLLEEKPKKELRFAAKIAVAMDADGFIGVKNSVCADAASIDVKHSIKHPPYCMSSPSSLQRKERPPSKQARPHMRRRWRRWKLFRRIRRSRVLFACLFQKVRKAFTSSLKPTLEAHDKFIK